MRRFNKKNRGVSLVELIVAIGVISIAILSLYYAILYGIKVNNQAKHLTLSYEIASKEMETVRSTPFANLANQTNGNFYSDSSADLAKLSGGQGKLTIRDYNGSSSIKEIIVTVNWNENGNAKTTILNTLATSGGINQ